MNTSSEKIFADFFLSYGHSLSYKKNEVIMRPDDTPSGVYYIKSGHVRTYSITENGSERIHIIYKPGDIFPLMWALADVQKELFYESMEDTVLIKVAKNDFKEFINSNHTATLDLLQKTLGLLSMFSDRIDDLEVSKTYPRIVSSILFFAKQYGESLSTESKKQDSCIITPPLTHQDIANFSTVARETTSREISALLKKKIISYRGHLIIVNSIKTLKKELLKSSADS